MMKATVAGFTSVIAIMAVIGGVNAQSADSTSGASSNSGAVSGSTSSSSAGGGTSNANQNSKQNSNFSNKSTTNTGVTLNQSSTSPDKQGINYSGGTNNSSYNRNDGDVTVRTTPTVYAPPVSGGNPCTLAVSGGVSVIGWGAAAGGTFVDEDCANRQKIAMIHNAGYQHVAFELMCNDRATYNAVKASANMPGARQCAFRQQFEPQGAVPVAGPVQQVPATMAPIVPPPPPVVSGGPLPGRNTLPRCRGPNDQGPCFSG